MLPPSGNRTEDSDDDQTWDHDRGSPKSLSSEQREIRGECHPEDVLRGTPTGNVPVKTPPTPGLSNTARTAKDGVDKTGPQMGRPHDQETAREHTTDCGLYRRAPPEETARRAKDRRDNELDQFESHGRTGRDAAGRNQEVPGQRATFPETPPDWTSQELPATDLHLDAHIPARTDRDDLITPLREVIELTRMGAHPQNQAVSPRKGPGMRDGQVSTTYGPPEGRLPTTHGPAGGSEPAVAAIDNLSRARRGCLASDKIAVSEEIPFGLFWPIVRDEIMVAVRELFPRGAPNRTDKVQAGVAQNGMGPIAERLTMEGADAVDAELDETRVRDTHSITTSHRRSGTLAARRRVGHVVQTAATVDAAAVQEAQKEKTRTEQSESRSTIKSCISMRRSTRASLEKRSPLGVATYAQALTSADDKATCMARIPRGTIILV